MNNSTQANLVIVDTAKKLVELMIMRRSMEVSRITKKWLKDNEQKKR